MKTIVVPTDLSPDTEIALSVAVDIASVSGVTAITLLHVVAYPLPMPVYAYVPATTVPTSSILAEYREIEQEAESALKRFANQTAYAGVTITPALITNGEGLVTNLTKYSADLIVMTSEGASGWDEFLFGSNAEEVVRYAHCPVLIVKQRIPHFQPENIVYAVDVDAHLKTVQHYPFRMGEGGLHQFLHVMSPSDNRNPEVVREWVSDFALGNGITNYDLIMRSAKSVPEGIICYADNVKADLIVLFTHGHKGIRHLLSGSVAEDVLNHATMPVLVMRA
ncbi:universal stress protein [Spirosoma spitsbergense]|uniref:universal stress protein n=1 Tax=Spirosoma spitsbergense TaxID=431554 RepID=UPI00036F64A1|nr:universal stress protein [Spirosoma spitsbergense]